MRVATDGACTVQALHNKKLVSGFADAYTNSGTPLHGQWPITACTSASDTWMAWDGCTESLAFTAVVFRHPKISSNFLYYDGHAENLRTTEIDGATGSSAGGPGWPGKPPDTHSNRIVPVG